jgi:hypothetical protein
MKGYRYDFKIKIDQEKKHRIGQGISVVLFEIPW